MHVCILQKTLTTAPRRKLPNSKPQACHWGLRWTTAPAPARCSDPASAMVAQWAAPVPTACARLPHYRSRGTSADPMRTTHLAYEPPRLTEFAPPASSRDMPPIPAVRRGATASHGLYHAQTLPMDRGFIGLEKQSPPATKSIHTSPRCALDGSRLPRFPRTITRGDGSNSGPSASAPCCHHHRASPSAGIPCSLPALPTCGPVLLVGRDLHFSKLVRDTRSNQHIPTFDMTSEALPPKRPWAPATSSDSK